MSRLTKALKKEGVEASEIPGVGYRLRTASDDKAPVAEVLLPDSLPLESKAAVQLANLTGVVDPTGEIRPLCIRAMPDFHPGDAGIPIGTVISTPGNMVIPAAIGSDINCGMRLHTIGITLEEFLPKKDQFVALLKGDYLLGTRDIGLTPGAREALFTEGVGGLALSAQSERQAGNLSLVNWAQVFEESSRIFHGDSFRGSMGWAPPVTSGSGSIRDDGLATIGRGNHFVEVLVAEEGSHYPSNLKSGSLVFLIHSGSRTVGLYVGKRWLEIAKNAWPQGQKYPVSGIFPLTDSVLIKQYLAAEATAANYGFGNRALLAELFRLRLREVFGRNLEVPLVYDVPHNITLKDDKGYVARKGACPAPGGGLVLIPGSMGTASYLCEGLGNVQWMSSASHGAGRAHSRGSMRHEKGLGLEGVECFTLREERKVEEAPSAYKPIQPIIQAQVDAGTIEVLVKFRPLFTFKA